MLNSDYHRYLKYNSHKEHKNNILSKHLIKNDIINNFVYTDYTTFKTTI